MNEEQVESYNDLIKYIAFLAQDFKKNKDKQEWANISIDNYLESIAAWLKDRKDLQLEPSWKSFAVLLHSGKIYE